MIRFPRTLPKPKLTYGLSPRENVVSSEMESGLYVQQKQYTGEQDSVRASWTFSRLEYKVFREFVKSDLASGSLDFVMEIMDGETFVDRTVRILRGAYSVDHQSHLYWNVSATIQVDDPVDVSAQLIAYLEDSFVEGRSLEDASCEFTNLSDRLHIFVHETFPQIHNIE